MDRGKVKEKILSPNSVLGQIKYLKKSYLVDFKYIANVSSRRRTMTWRPSAGKLSSICFRGSAGNPVILEAIVQR